MDDGVDWRDGADQDLASRFSYRPLPQLRAAYSDRAAAFMAQLCSLAYIPFETSPFEEERLRRTLAAEDFHLIATFAPPQKSSKAKGKNTQPCVEGFFTAHRFGHLAALVFRGTTDKLDWRTNFQTQRDEIPIGGPGDASTRSVRVHRGFHNAYRAIHDEVHPQMTRFWTDYPRTPVFITGHSLGGAIAQIASAYFTSDHIAACYTFGGPRVAERDFDTLVKAPLYRVVNGFDIVPKLPFRIMGYCHTGDIRYMQPGQPLRMRRRDLGTLSSIMHDFTGALGSLVRRRLLGIDDHLIETYIARLEAYVMQRETLTQEIQI